MIDMLIIALIVLSIFLSSLLSLAVILFLLFLFLLVRPAKKREVNEKLLCEYAHRGLHGDGVPENSLEAFELACKSGYGIELDVQLSRDGEVMVFHDYTLDRMCGESGKISDLTLAELRGIRLLGTEEGIPTLREVLETVGGRVPLLVELKGESADDALCLATAELLDEYDGVYAVESFNPLLLRWFKTNRPSVARGQLVTNMMKNRKEGNKLLNFLLTGLFLNFLSRPDFIACDIKHMGGPSFYICVKLFRAKQVYWTVKSRDDFNAIREAEAYSIFEGFIPR